MTPLTREERLALALAVVALVALAWMSAAQADESFQVDAGPASRTLNLFSQQSGLQVLFDYNSVRQCVTQTIDGELDVRAALAKLLAGTGLVFEFVNAWTLAIVPARKNDAGEVAGIQGSGEVDENGYFGCSPLRYTYSLDGYLQSSSRDEELCLKVAGL